MRVSTGSLDRGHDFCGSQAVGSRAEGRRVLFMCFIDLQKTYDTVNRTLWWQALTCTGVPPQMIAVIRQFHDGTRGCVRPYHGVCLDWFEVEQELRQGCVLSPLLFNIVFAAVLKVCPSKIQRGTGPSRRAGAPEGAPDVNGTGSGYGLRSSCRVRHAAYG